MPESENHLIRPVGIIRSSLHSAKDAPMQGAQGAPDAVIEIYTVLEVMAPDRIKVQPLEAVDGTPVIDIKPTID
jgi:tRNA (Thr-GGU) A37 N-methylase